MTTSHSNLLMISALLWVIWGAVHALAGILILAGDATSGFQAIADAVDPATLAMAYPNAVGGVLGQHAWNLTWFGLATIVGAILIWRHSFTAIWFTAIVGGLADLGYFIFIDLPGFAKFFPGTVMTLVSSAAIVLSAWVWIRSERRDVV